MTTHSWRLSVAMALLVGALGGCDASMPPPSTLISALPVEGLHVGRTACSGSLAQVAQEVDDDRTIDLLEGLQTTYEGDPGFLAMVWDGTRAVIVVEAGWLPAWQTRLAPLGIAVAPSCINPALLAAIHSALPRIAAQSGGGIMAGYNGVDDAIEVMGVEPNDLLAALDEVHPDARDAAVAAIADGTLRIDPRSAGGFR